MSTAITIEKCRCGQKGCKTYWLVGIGSFYQGSGFTKEEAERTALALNTHDDLVRLLGWCVDSLRVRSPEALALHPEGSQAAELLAVVVKMEAGQ